MLVRTCQSCWQSTDSREDCSKKMRTVKDLTPCVVLLSLMNTDGTLSYDISFQLIYCTDDLFWKFNASYGSFTWLKEGANVTIITWQTRTKKGVKSLTVLTRMHAS